MEEKRLALKKLQWKISLIFGGGLSFFSILLPLVIQPKDPHYAGAIFSHNIELLFPALILSMIFGITGLCFYIPSFLKVKFVERFEYFQRIFLPVILLFPGVLLFIVMCISLTRIIIAD